jgi:hypothetical protein
MIFFVAAIAMASVLLEDIISSGDTGCNPSTLSMQHVVTSENNSSEVKNCNPFTPQVEILKAESGKIIGRFAELSGRISCSEAALLFFLSIAALYVVMLWNVFIAVRQSILQILIIGLFILAIALLVGHGLSIANSFGFNEPLLGPTVYSVSSALKVVDIIQSLAVATLFSLAVVLSVLNWRTSEEVLVNDEINLTKSNAEEIYWLATMKRRVQALLYLGAIVLVAGTIQTSALYTWAISMIDPSIDMASSGAAGAYYFGQLQDVPKLMGFLNGAFYSILLVTVFTPAFVHFRLLSLKLARSICHETNIQEQQSWLEENSLSGTGVDQIVSILLMLAPVIAGGPFSMLLDIAV